MMKHKCVFSFLDESSEYPMPALPGIHQVHNAAIALAVLWHMREQGFNVSDQAISEGLKNCQWPGRLQRIDAQWPGGAGEHEIWLDCGHNDSAGEALALQLGGWGDKSPRPVYLILGMLGTKDSKGFLAPLLPDIEGLYVIPVAKDPTSQSAEQIQEACGPDVLVKTQDHFKNAIDDILNSVEGPVRILIAGSVYLAGDVLSFIKASESR